MFTFSSFIKTLFVHRWYIIIVFQLVSISSPVAVSCSRGNFILWSSNALNTDQSISLTSTRTSVQLTSYRFKKRRRFNAEKQIQCQIGFSTQEIEMTPSEYDQLDAVKRCIVLIQTFKLLVNCREKWRLT